MRFAVSVVASRHEGGRVLIRHFVGFVEADSRDEALGRVYRAARRAYPPDDGWENHHVLVTWAGEPSLDPDTVSLKPSDY